MKKKIIFFILSLFTMVSIAQESLIISKVAVAPIIDAVASDWGNEWIKIAKKERSFTNNMSAKFQMAYDEDNLYIVIEVSDTTPNFDSISIPNTYERDCVTLYISMDTVTYPKKDSYPRGIFHEGCWQLRKLRMPELGGLEGSGYKVGGGATWNIKPLISNVNFKAVSSGIISPYCIEWQIPWDSLTYQMGSDTIPAWDKKKFKFEVLVTDNTTGKAGGFTQLNHWSNFEYLNYFPLTDMLGLINLIDELRISRLDGRKLNIYPNPISISSTIEIYDNNFSKIRVIDISGRLVKQINIQNQSKVFFSRDGLSCGLYFIELFGKEKSSEICKVIIN